MVLPKYRLVRGFDRTVHLLAACIVMIVGLTVIQALVINTAKTCLNDRAACRGLALK
jgi:hypothetical protein